MSETTIAKLPDPSGFSADPFTDIIRDGARKLIEQAIYAQLATLMAAFSTEMLEDRRARLVRHGHLLEREVMTGIGPVAVNVPRVRDRKPGEDKITFRESAESWRELLLDLQRRGLKQDPKLAIGDGALGFWTALREVFATTREQRCWVHKTVNVLNTLPKCKRQGAPVG